ncbi:MAG: hypothetical protein AB7S26_11395 [Sandaracinaceae bacterium]
MSARALGWGIASLLAASAVGCDDGAPNDAGGGGDAGPMVDAGGGGTDAGRDAGTVGCGGHNCQLDEACVRDVCVATCGEDTSGWDAALAARFTPVHAFCEASGTIDVAHDATDTTVFQIETTMIATGTTFTLSSWPLDLASAPSPTMFASFDVAHDDMTFLFVGELVRPSPDGMSVLVGYTLGDTSSTGELFNVVRADGTHMAFPANGNYDAVWVDNGTVLVNGLGLGAMNNGQGLYASKITAATLDETQVATGLGDASGSVLLTGDYLLAGGYSFADSASHVYAIGRQAVDGVLDGSRSAIDFAAEGVEVCPTCGLSSSFRRIDDHLVMNRYDASFMQDGILAYPITGFDATTGLALGDEEEWVTDGTFTSAFETHDGVLLRFAGGLLLVR